MQLNWRVGLLALGMPLAAVAGAMQVQVEKGQVRAQPSFLGRVVTTLGYGQTVNAVAEQGSWVKVQMAGGEAGWMAASALSSKRITARQTSGAAGSNASADDLALAGKGFSASIENEFKKQNPNINFAAVNRMERDKASTSEMRDFIAEGSLYQPGARK